MVEGERNTVMGRGVVIGGVALLAAGVFIASVTIAYQMGLETGRSGTTPIIRADDGPVKFRPQDPGGMKIPNRNKEIYQQMAKKADKAPRARMLPPPEKPIENLLLTLDRSFAGGGTPAAPEDVSQPAPLAPGQSAARKIEPLAAPGPVAVDGARETAAGAVPAPRRRPIQWAAVANGGTASDGGTDSAAGRQVAALPGASAGGFAAQLAATRTRESAGAALNKLRKANPALFQGLRPEIVTSRPGKSRGTWYRLRVGPFASRKAARGYCGRAAARKVACLIVSR